MLKNRKGTKIYKNFIFSYIVTLIVPMLIMSVIVLYHFVNVLKDEVEINLKNPLIKSIDNFDAQIDQLAKTSLQIELNDFFRTVNIHKTPYDAVKIKNELLKYSTNSFFNEIFIYNYNDNYISSYNYLCSIDIFNNFVIDPNRTDFDLMKFKESDQQDGVYYFAADSINLDSKQNHLMYLNKVPIHSTKPYEIIMYMIPESSLKSVLDPAISENSYLFIIDPVTKKIMFNFSDNQNSDLVKVFQQTLYSSGRIQDIRETNILNKKYSSYVFESTRVPYIFIQLMPNDLLSSKINQIRTTYLSGMVIIIVLSGMVIAILMRINYRPIKNLKKLLEENLQPFTKSVVQNKLNELELLEYALLQYNKENIDLKEYATANKDAVKYYLIDCFLAGQANEIDNILETCRNAELDFNKNYYCAIILKSSNIQNIPASWIQNVIASIQKPDESQIFLHRDIHLNSIVLIYGSIIKDENQSRVLAQQLLKLLNEEYQNDFRVGVGSFYDSIFHIDTSYEDALKVLDYNNILSKSNIICFNDIPQKADQNIRYPFTLFEGLETSVRRKDVFGIQDNINQLVYYLKNENLSLYWVKNICYETVSTISKELLKKYNHSPLLNKPYIEKIYGAEINSFEDIVSIMKEISEDITSYLNVDMESYELKLLQRIILYIRNNYLDPEFSLQSLADSLQMSTPYLSQYFKKNTDYTISEYVTRLRMEKAKDLLIKTEMSVHEIAAEVGYYSVSSFIRKFREIENVTPGQCKKKYS